MGCQPSTMVARLLSRFHLLPVPPARINVPSGSLLHRALAGEDLRPEMRALAGLKPVELDPEDEVPRAEDDVDEADDSDPLVDVLRRRPTKDRRMKELTPERILQVQRQSRWMLQAFPFDPSPTLATVAAWDQARRFHRIIPQRQPVDPSSTYREQLQEAEERRVRMQHAAEDAEAGRQRTLAMISLDLADQVAEIDWQRMRGLPKEQYDEIVREHMAKEREHAKKHVAEVAEETAARRARIAQRAEDKAAGRERDAAQDKDDDEAEADHRHLVLAAAGGRTPSLGEREYIVQRHIQAQRDAAEARLVAFDSAEMHQLDDPDMVDEDEANDAELDAARSEIDRPLNEEIDVDEDEDELLEDRSEKPAAIEAGEAKEGEEAEAADADKDVAEKKDSEEEAVSAEDEAEAAELDAKLKALGVGRITQEDLDAEAAERFAQDRDAEDLLKNSPEDSLDSLSSVAVEEVVLKRRFVGAEYHPELLKLQEEEEELEAQAKAVPPQFEKLTREQRHRLLVDKLHENEEASRQEYVLEQRAVLERNKAKIAKDTGAEELTLEPVDMAAIKFDDYLTRERNVEAAEAAAAAIELARIDADADALDEELDLDEDAEGLDEELEAGLDANENLDELLNEKEALIDANEEVDLDEEEVREQQEQEREMAEEPVDEAEEEDSKGRGRKDE